VKKRVTNFAFELNLCRYTAGKVASKVEDKSTLGELSELAMSLRKQQEAEMELQQQLHDQYDRKEQADHNYQRTVRLCKLNPVDP
jgi:hypothetical protein